MDMPMTLPLPMDTVPSDAGRGVAIKSVACLVPGHGQDGAPFGELIPTTTLFENMTDVLMRNGRAGSDFIARRLGIRNVAATHTSAALCRAIWSGGMTAAQAARFAGVENAELYAMLQCCIRQVLDDDTGGSPWPRVRAHIHILTCGHATGEHEMMRVRRELGIDHPDLHSLIVQQGCAGLFSALKTARSLLASAEYAEGDRVLITAENNMVPYLHQRAAGNADYADIDSWLFPCIFGEGAGALVVGRATHLPTRSEWRLEGLADEYVVRDWRVASRWNDAKGCSEIVARAREVKQTFLTHVSRHAEQALAECGGAEHVFRLCLHESNPLLVQAVAARVGFPMERVPSISAQVGTLAIVSAFSLLQRATADIDACDSGPDQLAMVLIGESHGIRAGRLRLRRARATAAMALGARDADEEEWTSVW